MKRNDKQSFFLNLENSLINLALLEDLGDGDHTSLSCLNNTTFGNAIITAKENGVVSGLDIAAKVFVLVDPNIDFTPLIKNGESFEKGKIVAELNGPESSILTAERLALNFLQRMSGVATLTHQITQHLKGSKTKLLDTRKTTPGFRFFEKKAVIDGGGKNHRFGLFDMILIKDNHIDYCGGITAAINAAKVYLEQNQLDLPIEVETRNITEVQEVLNATGVARIMLDNFSPSALVQAVKLIDGKIETEASGGININNIGEYAQCGVDYISMGFITHSYRSIDFSLTTKS